MAKARTRFDVEKDLQAVAKGKPTTPAQFATLMLRALEEVAERQNRAQAVLDAMSDELDDVDASLFDLEAVR